MTQYRKSLLAIFLLGIWHALQGQVITSAASGKRGAVKQVIN